MTGTLELTARIDHLPRERPLARTPVARYRLARHRCRGARVVFCLWALSVYFLLQKLLYLVYRNNTTLTDGQSRRVNQQSHQWTHLGSPISPPFIRVEGQPLRTY